LPVSTRSTRPLLDQYPIITRPYVSGLGLEQIVKSLIGRAWSGNLGDRDSRVNVIGSGHVALNGTIMTGVAMQV